MTDTAPTDGSCSTAFHARRQAKEGRDLATQSLIAEFADVLPPGTVIRSVALAREELLRSGVRHGLATATRAMRAHRLRTSVRPACGVSARIGRVVG